MIKYQLNKTRVWSLGTSVNSVGKSHHIIPSVESPMLIDDFFDDVWSQNDADKCKIYDYDEMHIYGKRSNCAKNPDRGLYYAGIWQELGLKESDACTEWARNILL